MKVWVVRDLEPIPGDPNRRRLLRTHMVCTALAEAGHEVTWFTSSFDHYLKRQRETRDTRLVVGPAFAIEVLACRGYRSNVSLRRIWHNREFARRFRQRFLAAPALPQVLVTDIPTTETAAAVVALGEANAIPTVLSVRDIWPDSFPELLPPAVRPIAAPFIALLRRQAEFALRHATSVVGISEQYLEWGRRKGRRPPGARDRVVPLGYLPTEVTAEDREATLARLSVGADRFIVAFVGSWGRTADMDLVAAMAEQCASRPDIRFVIGGNTDGNPSAARRLGRLDNVRLAGWLSDEEIAVLLGAAHLGLLPYRVPAPQGLPNKTFEYLAYGVHQLSTLGGEIAALYRETGAGEVVSPPTAAAFAEAIAAHADGRRVRLERADLQHTFAERFAAQRIYADFAQHIADVARASLP